MRLRDIAEIDSDSEVTGFAIDHRKVAAGSVFGAFRGAVVNGEEFIPQAIKLIHYEIPAIVKAAERQTVTASAPVINTPGMGGASPSAAK